MRIAVCQLAPDYALPPADLRTDVAAVVRGQAGADLVVLPELWLAGGFTYERWAACAEPLDGPTLAAVSAAAVAVGAWVHGGSIVERDADGRLFNTSVLVAPDGTVAATYRKIHLYGFDEGEPELMDAGSAVVVADTALGRIGLATCYDLRFPEQFRALADDGAELVVVPAAWPAVRVGHWSVLARARAIENQYAVVAANTAGVQAGKQMGGMSVIVGATGEVLAEAGAEAEVLTAEVDLTHVADWRTRFPAQSNRRRDLF